MVLLGVSVNASSVAFYIGLSSSNFFYLRVFRGVNEPSDRVKKNK